MEEKSGGASVVKSRDNRRRWKARCKRGDIIPLSIIVQYNRTKWFQFEPVNYLTHTFVATGSK